jgi:hypothetical protein
MFLAFRLAEPFYLMGEMESCIFHPPTEVFYVSALEKHRQRLKHHVGLVDPPPNTDRLFEGLFKKPLYAKGFLQSPHYIRNPYLPGANIRAAIAPGAITDQMMVLLHLLIQEETDEEILGIGIDTEVVDGADRCADLAAQAGREISRLITSEGGYGINLRHRATHLL